MKLNNGRMQWQSQGFKNIVGTILARGLDAGPAPAKGKWLQCQCCSTVRMGRSADDCTSW